MLQSEVGVAVAERAHDFVDEQRLHGETRGEGRKGVGGVRAAMGLEG